MGPIVVSLMLILAGILAAVDANGGAEVDGAFVLAACLGLAGLGLVVSAFVGRARGLITIGLLLVPPLAALSLIDVPFHPGIGERSFQPRVLDAVRDHYRLGIGEMQIDLSDLTIPEGTRLAVSADQTIGELIITVPDDVNLDISGTVGAGEIEMFDRVGPGFDFEHEARDDDNPHDGESGVGVEVNERADSVQPARGRTLVVDFEMGLGSVEVIRVAG